MIWLFGDSFFDLPSYETSLIYWVDLLSEKANTYNLAKGGTGPHYMLPLIESQLHKIKKDDVIICHISDKWRITFPSEIIPKDQMMQITRKGCNSNNKVLLEYYENNKNSINFSFETFEKLIDELPQYTLSFLYSLNIKTIVFSSGLKAETRERFRLLNNDIFHLSGNDLFDVSSNEFTEFNRDWFNALDLRNNHLSEENHYILVEYINNVLSNKKTLPKFKDKFINKDEVIQTEKFVYE